MAEAAQQIVMMSAEDYLAAENDGDWRHEFVNGSVYAMVGSSDRHNLITGAMYVALSAGLPDRCQLFATDMKLRIRAATDERYYYPDLFVSCSAVDRDRYTRSEPVLIAEVLSPWTERIDRGEKFEAYRSIPTLQEYALLSQDEVRLELFRRRTSWQRELYGPGGAVTFESIDLTTEVAALYRRTGLQTSQ